MPYYLSRFNGYSIFDDKGEVKRLVESLIQGRDPDASVERLRKMDETLQKKIEDTMAEL